MNLYSLAEKDRVKSCIFAKIFGWQDLGMNFEGWGNAWGGLI